MQIHEITQPKQSLASKIGSAAKQAAGGFISGLIGVETGIGAANPATQAAQAAAGLVKKGYGPGYQGGSTDWQEKYKTVLGDPAVSSYISSIASAWPASEPKEPTVTQEATDDNIGSPQPGAPTAAEREKLQQRISQATKAATAQSNSAKQQYLDQFKSWSDSQLLTKTSYGDRVEMDAVRALPGIQAQLNQYLEGIWTSKGTPQQQRAIQEYLKVAVAGVQAVAQAFRNKRIQGGTRQKPINSTGDPDLDKALEKAGYRIVK